MDPQPVVSFAENLTDRQRQVADNILLFICRGKYAKALAILNTSIVTLPIIQEYTLRQVIDRLRRTRKLNSLIVCESLIQKLQFPNLNLSVISTMDTQMPRNVLGYIYDQLQQHSIDRFYKQLKRIQWAEHTIIQHTIMLYDHCTKLKRAQIAIAQLEYMSGRRGDLYILYALTFLVGIYLVLLLF